ncbi:MAG: ThiF family adenylyltransferase [Pseudomonadota bacterium]
MAGGDVMSRYARQMILPEVGDAGQRRLTGAHALVVGAGGLGAPVLQYLAGAGVGAITIVDPDVVDLGNLHRQVIFANADIGAPKAEAAARFAAALNPDVDARARREALTPANAPALIAAADVALDCADSFAASYTLSDACFAAGTPLISASALGLSGYAGGFCAGAPSLRAVFPDLPDRTASCAEAGVLGPVVGVVGAAQAQMALSLLLGAAPSPLGLVARYDAATLRMTTFRFDDAPEPAGRPFAFIAPTDIAAGDFVVDLRGADEAPRPATPDALRADVAAFGPDGPSPAAGQRAVFCCRSGLRAWRAAARLSPVWDGEIALVALGDPP